MITILLNILIRFENTVHIHELASQKTLVLATQTRLFMMLMGNSRTRSMKASLHYMTLMVRIVTSKYSINWCLVYVYKTK